MGKDPVYASNELDSEENPTYIVSRQINISETEVEDENPPEPEDKPTYVATPEKIPEDQGS